MLGTTRKNPLMFDKLCGEDALDVALVTTKWGEIQKVVGEQREKELKETYWKTMIDHGSQIRRYTDSSDSAWAIVNLICKKKGLPIQVRNELFDLQTHIPQTEAGDASRKPLILYWENMENEYDR